MATRRRRLALILGGIALLAAVIATLVLLSRPAVPEFIRRVAAVEPGMTVAEVEAILQRPADVEDPQASRRLMLDLFGNLPTSPAAWKIWIDADGVVLIAFDPAGRAIRKELADLRPPRRWPFDLLGRWVGF